MSEILEKLERLVGQRETPGFNPTAMDYWNAVHMALDVIRKLSADLVQALKLAEGAHASNEKALNLVIKLQGDRDRLVEFATVQGIDLRDNNDAEASLEYWRSLPQHLQDAINAKTEALDEEADLL